MNSFWIFGLAVVLAAFSYHYWQADSQKRPLSQQLRRDSFRSPAWIGLVLVGIGLAGTSQRPWEAALWILFVVFGIINSIKSWPAAGRS